MLLFSTILNINKTLTRDAFMRLVLQWNRESTYAENIIEDLRWDGRFPARFGNDDLFLAAAEYSEKNIIAVRFEKHREDGSVWDTDYVMDFRRLLMCIRLERSYREDAQIMQERFSTPHFITLLEQKGYLSEDGDLPVSRVPYQIGTEQLNLLSDVILQKKTYRLPVIYVSRRFDGSLPVDAELLASRVKGVAHVLILEHPEDVHELRRMCEDKNEYSGAAGICFPGEAMGKRRFITHVREGYDETMLERLARAVIVFAGSRITEPLLTWQGVNNALLNERIRVNIRERQAAEEARRKAEQEYRSLQDTLDEKQRAIRKQALEDARSEAEKILDGFDNELHYYEKQIEDLTKANDALQIENQGLKSRLDSSGETPLIHSGREADFYPGEIRDLLLTQLSDTLSSVGDKTRRRDVIEDILSANEWDHRSEKNAEEIKKLLKTYAGMTSAIRQKLESLGFVITEDGKHYKLTYYGDDRYQIILSKTPSDIRTGKNSSQKLSKMVF